MLPLANALGTGSDTPSMECISLLWCVVDMVCDSVAGGTTCSIHVPGCAAIHELPASCDLWWDAGNGNRLMDSHGSNALGKGRIACMALIPIWVPNLCRQIGCTATSSCSAIGTSLSLASGGWCWHGCSSMQTCQRLNVAEGWCPTQVVASVKGFESLVQVGRSQRGFCVEPHLSLEPAPAV